MNSRKLGAFKSFDLFGGNALARSGFGYPLRFSSRTRKVSLQAKINPYSLLYRQGKPSSHCTLVPASSSQRNQVNNRVLHLRPAMEGFSINAETFPSFENA